MSRPAPDSTTYRQSLPRALLHTLLVCLFAPVVGSAAETVRATLGTETAWTGEGVPLAITLYSPGPFSGSAAFDLPELPRTAFVKVGSPLVGSESVDSETYFTQRHESMVYTQRSGEIVIPSIQTRFAGKRTFTSDAEPMHGSTSELRFHSMRPPGTESTGVVVCATKTDIGQTWSPEQISELTAGDVLTRVIIRTAEGTTAMMLPALRPTVLDGVRVHQSSPAVEDKFNRGDATAHRTDTVKYQFESAGTFTLPEFVFSWWDPDQERLQQETLSSRTVKVTNAPAAPTVPEGRSETDSSRTLLLGLVASTAIACLVLLCHRPLRGFVSRQIVVWNRPEARAARDLRAACASNDARAAYSAFIAWLAAERAMQDGDCTASFLDRDENQRLRDQWQVLSQQLFASHPTPHPWDAIKFWTEFSRIRGGRHRGRVRMRGLGLPALNPTARPGSG